MDALILPALILLGVGVTALVYLVFQRGKPTQIAWTTPPTITPLRPPPPQIHVLDEQVKNLQDEKEKKVEQILEKQRQEAEPLQEDPKKLNEFLNETGELFHPNGGEK